MIDVGKTEVAIHPHAANPLKIGIYQSYWGAVGGGQRYVGVVAAMLGQYHQVEIIHHAKDFDRDAVEKALELDLSEVRFRLVERRDRPSWPSRNPLVRLRLERAWCREISMPYDVFIDSSDIPPFFCHAHRGVLITHFPLISFEEFHGRNTDAWRCRSAPAKWALSLFHRLEWRSRFQSYDRFVVNSEFTKRWIRRLWGVQADVLYPPLRRGLKPLRKRPIILNVSAFHRAQHKRHHVLIESFRQLCAQNYLGWQLVLVGACGNDADDLAYVESLRESARGLPVAIRTNLDGAALKELFGEASVFWHSMGYGVDPNREPRLMEHFGMVAVEAMAAGCVPVLFCGGGLREIVSSGKDGFLWSTVDELLSSTRLLLEDEALRSRLSQAAVRRSCDF
jgi:glycosyltransferase involved in cell wall biosynthesis